jgi:hypothetical protein
MKIETRFEIEDDVCSLIENKIEWGKINDIRIEVYRPVTIINYFVTGIEKVMEEESLFPTKQELLDSL